MGRSPGFTPGGGRHAGFEAVNRNQRSITLDLKQDKGRAILYRLVEKTDVFFTNYTARVARELDTPIAADESMAGPDDARRVLDQGAAQVLVIKPMVVGGLRPARRIAGMAIAAGAAAVVTTTIDGGIGVAAALHLAATLPADGPACGLATASLLAGDIVTGAPAVREGRMTLPAAPGLGVTLDERAIARFACAGADPPK